MAKVAARSAYYAAFHAAEAFVVAKSGKVAKSHSGVRSEFARFAKADPRIGKVMTAFLALAYKYKEIGDYGIGADAIVTMADAQAAIQSADDFLARVEALLA